MKIDHVALYVRDLEAAKDFFVRYFDAIPSGLYHNPQTGLKTYFLTFDGESRLELMCRPEVGEGNRRDLQTGYQHLAFRVGGRENVDWLTARLQADGYTVLRGPRVTGDGYYESCIAGFEGNWIELTE